MRLILSFLISMIPINVIKIFLFRFILRYRISYDSPIGFFNILVSKSVDIRSATIGNFNLIFDKSIDMDKGSIINKFNRLKNVNNLILKEEAIINSWNLVSGFAEKSRNIEMIFKNQNLTLGKKTGLLRKNTVDLVEEVTIGDNVVIGGYGGEFWTHGFDTERNFLKGKIVMGNNIFVGSKCMFTKNITVCDDVTIGPGTIVFKSIEYSGLYSTHELKKIK